ncbi:hypothetical protein NECAME_11455 [Necator americanus]|uniref:Uncharacterized protein n=1 Tax=Necator americanus TaxID=51031 RepID=W2T441_NECAM|nr:hypothetical protein NECAME_11455 [Necator americanus]ETN76765.1 hypothetical protein NECAME_11455 [Necator americanus]
MPSRPILFQPISLILHRRRCRSLLHRNPKRRGQGIVTNENLMLTEISELTIGKYNGTKR